MLTGYPPFYDDNPFGIYEKILSGKIDWPKHLDTVAKDLIKKLLVQDRTKRLGNMKVSFYVLSIYMQDFRNITLVAVTGDSKLQTEKKLPINLG